MPEVKVNASITAGYSGHEKCVHFLTLFTGTENLCIELGSVPGTLMLLSLALTRLRSIRQVRLRIRRLTICIGFPWYFLGGSYRYRSDILVMILERLKVVIQFEVPLQAVMPCELSMDVVHSGTRFRETANSLIKPALILPFELSKMSFLKPIPT